MGWTPATSAITVTWADASSASAASWSNTTALDSIGWTDNSVASTVAYAVPTGSPTTLGLQEAPLKPFDIGDGSLRFNLMCNDDAPIFLNDAWPFHVVDEGKLS